jgi:glycine/D-amino acid oxidase-like deaminating enzyme
MPSEIAKPYWQDGWSAGLPEISLPTSVDVLIVGAGYTGLSAARETAKAGAATLVLDAAAIGAGCSGRNGGQVAYSIKPSLATLTARHGSARAYAICREGFSAMAYLRALATDAGVDCDWRAHGCFFGAHTARHFAALAREAEHQPAGLEQRISVVGPADQRSEIASDFYHGGLVYHDDAAVDPMRMLLGLLRRAQTSGAAVVEHCPVKSLTRLREGFEIATPRGVVRAAKVLLATNGHSGPLSSWHRRRVIPIGSYQIATEPLGCDRVRELIPHARNIVDTRRVVVYYRPSADGERIIFGGRAALAETNAHACVPRLRAMLTQVFPQLRSVAITHAWTGWVAYTFDTLPHLGQKDGLYHCMGYCGQGVPLAPYFGCRVGQQMVGLAEGRTALDDLPFPSRPYYQGVPWFLAPSVFAYRTLDRLGW